MKIYIFCKIKNLLKNEKNKFFLKINFFFFFLIFSSNFQLQFGYFPKDFAPEILQKLQIDSNASIDIRIILFGFLLPRFFYRTAYRTAFYFLF